MKESTRHKIPASEELSSDRIAYIYDAIEALEKARMELNSMDVLRDEIGFYGEGGRTKSKQVVDEFGAESKQVNLDKVESACLKLGLMPVILEFDKARELIETADKEKNLVLFVNDKERFVRRFEWLAESFGMHPDLKQNAKIALDHLLDEYVRMLKGLRRKPELLPQKLDEINLVKSIAEMLPDSYHHKEFEEMSEMINQKKFIE